MNKREQEACSYTGMVHRCAALHPASCMVSKVDYSLASLKQKQQGVCPLCCNGAVLHSIAPSRVLSSSCRPTCQEVAQVHSVTQVAGDKHAHCKA